MPTRQLGQYEKQLGPHQKAGKNNQTNQFKVSHLEQNDRLPRYNPLRTNHLNQEKAVIQGYFRVKPEEYEVTNTTDKKMFTTNHIRLVPNEEAEVIKAYMEQEYMGRQPTGQVQGQAAREIGHKERKKIKKILDKGGSKTFKHLFDVTEAYHGASNPDYKLPRHIPKEGRMDYSPVVDMKFYGNKVNLFMDEDYQFAINAETTQPKECYMTAEALTAANQTLAANQATLDLQYKVSLRSEEGNKIHIQKDGQTYNLVMVRPDKLNLRQHDCKELSGVITASNKASNMEGKNPATRQQGDIYEIQGKEGKGRFIYHFAAIVAHSRQNDITLENYARSKEKSRCIDDLYKLNKQKEKLQEKLDKKKWNKEEGKYTPFYPKGGEERNAILEEWRGIDAQIGAKSREMNVEFAKSWYFSIYGNAQHTSFKINGQLQEQLKV